MYKIEFEKRAKKQFYKLSRDAQERLTKAIDEKLATNPKEHLVPLVGGQDFINLGLETIGFFALKMTISFQFWWLK